MLGPFECESKLPAAMRRAGLPDPPLGTIGAWRRWMRHSRSLSARCTVVSISALALAALVVSTSAEGADEWAGYERLTPAEVVARVANSTASAPADLSNKNLSGADLAHIDFKAANLSASVFNGSNLRGANLSRCNLTVSFGEHADFREANLRGAEMFSMQLAGADLRGADLTDARFIGDMSRARLAGAIVRNFRGAADMTNQSMGLMRSNFQSADLRGADFTGANLSRANFSFSDLSGAIFTNAKLAGAEFPGVDLSGADLSGADLRGSTFIDTTFTGAKLRGAQFEGSKWRGVRGLDDAASRGATGVPEDIR